eukprot:g42505.t1
MGVSGFEIDVDAQSVAGDGDREVQEGEGGVRDGPGEFEVEMKSVDEVDILHSKDSKNCRCWSQSQYSVELEEHGRSDSIRGAGELTFQVGILHPDLKGPDRNIDFPAPLMLPDLLCSSSST